MKIIRKINNNAAIAQDKRGRELVVLGRGVGFHPVPYELTDLSVIYRTYYDVNPKYFGLAGNFPLKSFWPPPKFLSRRNSSWIAN